MSFIKNFDFIKNLPNFLFMKLSKDKPFNQIDDPDYQTYQLLEENIPLLQRIWS